MSCPQCERALKCGTVCPTTKCAKCGKEICYHVAYICPHVEIGYACSLSIKDHLCENCYDSHMAKEHTGKPQHNVELTATSGFLSPDGKLYECAYGFHKLLAPIFGYNSTLQMEQDKWVKLQESYWFNDYLYDKKLYVTHAQYDTIYEWSIKHNRLDYMQGIVVE